ncbi:MAG: MBL fold metallo-hydrolase, partial [Actinomycetota bacterium]
SHVQGVDVLVHDAQYVAGELAEHEGWGHSSPEQAVAAAQAAGASELVLTSHDPRRTDAEIEEIVATARAIFPNVDAARPGMGIAL